ncbi:hypothetical protein AMECASPLE_008707 [Ameca splendens]|uniref:Uncharacterized protein n=1 Tax=Ameca splendens TaxID=208324 RepID=A0ABV0YAZ2_9TELE
MAWHAVGCYTDRLVRISAENVEVMLVWHDCVSAELSQISTSSARCHPSICSSLSLLCLGQSFTLLRSRFSLAFVTLFALLLLPSLIIPSLPIVSHYSSFLSILKNLTLSHLDLTLFLSHLPSSHPYARSYPHTHSVFNILEDIYEHESEHVHLHHFWCRGNLHFPPLASPRPPPLPYLANPDSGFGCMLLIFF